MEDAEGLKAGMTRMGKCILDVYIITETQEDFIREKSAASGGTRIHSTLLSEMRVLPPSY